MEVSSVVITIDEMKIQRPKLLSRSAVQFDLNLIKRSLFGCFAYNAKLIRHCNR